jgi:signal transduction histidine kinase
VAWAVIALVAILLPVLFVFQQRWIDELRAADRERRQAQVNATLQRFRADLNAEFERLVASFQFARALTPEENLGPRFREWARESSWSRYLEAVYLVTLEPGKEPWLRKLNTGSGRLEPAGWPPELEAFRERITSGEMRGVEPGDESVLVFPRMPRMWRMAPGGGPGEGEFPRWRPGPGGPPGGGPGGPPGGFLVVKLDRKSLESGLLAEIAARHFAGSEYLVRVIDRRGPGRILWEKDPGSTVGFEKPDASLAVFQPAENGPLRRRRPEFPGQPPDPLGGGAWIVEVKHPAGSLDAAVDQIHRRNELLGGGMLLLTGAAVAVLVVSVRRAQRLARLQMEFVAGVSHELKTPLAVIASAAANLADGVVERPDQVRRYGAVIRDQGRQLQDMVEQTLAFSRADAGRLEIRPQPVDVEEIVDRALEACAPEKGTVEVERKLDPHLPPVLADPTALTQAVRNLVSNALRYGKDGGWVGVSAAAENGSVAIRVADRGRGIDSADLPRLFDPFYRGRSAASAQVHGAGLGLSLVRRIAEAHGGKVEVQSAVGEGSEFTLRIPAAKA